MADLIYPPAPLALDAPQRIDMKPILREKLGTLDSPEKIPFDAEEHLAFKEYPKVTTLEDLSVSEGFGISDVGCSEPFPLFTEEAIKIMRSEIFRNEVWDNCLQTSDFAGCQLRGHCPNYAPFMYDAWRDPKTLEVISRIAGIDLVPVIDIEIGSINISLQDGDPRLEKTKGQSKDDIPVTKWHYDSYPFVCVVMMSDTTHMVGGETALQSGTGEIHKVRGPGMGSAVVLQGRGIRHQALGAVGGSERITMITAFRAKDPFVKDTSVLTTIRPITEPNELYFQWTEYRIQVLQKRLSGMLEGLEEQHQAGKLTDTDRIKRFLAEQAEWLSHTSEEIIPSIKPHITHKF